ncbi:MAG: PASTA domain-containing protein, partial [Gaiellaceae bacterium]
LGATSLWSETRSFRIDATPNTPALLAPAAGAARRSLALETSYVDPDGDAGALELRVCSTEAAAGVECTGHVLTGWFASVTQGESVRWAPGASLADGVYHWQARASDTLGAVSAWSATRTIRIDTTPPDAPAAFGGVVAEDGLTLRWEPPPGGEEMSSYVVYVDGRESQALGGQTYETKLGPFDARDARRFSVRAIDAAGNHGTRTSALVGVPDLVGMTRDEARAAVTARGLVIRDESGRSMRAVRRNEVVLAQTPEAPSIVGTGSAVAVVLSAPARVGLLGFTKLGASCTQRGRLTAQIWLGERARVSVTLLDRRKARVASWRLGALAEGTHRLTLRLPSSLRRPGHYRLFVVATA